MVSEEPRLSPKTDTILPATAVSVSLAAFMIPAKAMLGGGLAMILDASVIAPFSANSLPFTAAPVFSEMDWMARMLPLRTEFAPRVADVPTCQKTLEALAPPARTIWLPAAVVSVVAIWNMKTALGSPLASRVRLPEVILSEETEL